MQLSASVRFRDTIIAGNGDRVKLNKRTPPNPKFRHQLNRIFETLENAPQNETQTKKNNKKQKKTKNLMVGQLQHFCLMP
jgi:hypothetical protein